MTSSDWYNYSYSSSKHSHTTNSSNVIDTTTDSQNVTNTTSYLARDEDVAVIEMAVSATILFLAIAGNSCVIFSLAYKRKRQSRMHLMILHLSLADLFVAFFNVLPQLIWDITYRFEGGPFLCVLVKYFQVVAMYASSYVLLATAVDRYYAICHPFASQSWTAKHAHTLAIIAWTASLFFSLPQMFIFSYMEVEQGSEIYDCWAKFHPDWTLPAYITWMTASIFVVPTCLLGILYGQISWVVWKAGRLEEKLLPTKFTPLGPRHDNLDRSCDRGRHFQDITLNSSQCCDLTTNTLPTANKCHELAMNVRNHVCSPESGRMPETCITEITSNTGNLTERQPVHQMTQLKMSSSFEIKHTEIQELPDKRLASTYQFTAMNSGLKCENRREDPLNPLTYACVQPAIIRESVRMGKDLNETNFHKHNQKHGKNPKLRCGFPQHPHINAVRESYYMLNEETVCAGQGESIIMSVTERSEDVHAEVCKQVLNRTNKISGVHISESVPDCTVQMLLVDPKLSEFHKETDVGDMRELCTDKAICCENVLWSRDINSEFILEDKETRSARGSVDFSNLESFCSGNKNCRKERENFAQFGPLYTAEKSHTLLLKNNGSTICCTSCDRVMVSSMSNKEITILHCHAAKQKNGESIDDVDLYCTDELITDSSTKEHQSFDTDHDFLDKEHHSGTEDTVSTLGSLTSLKFFETTELVKPEFFTSNSGMNCTHCVSMPEDHMYSHTQCTGYVQQQQRQENYSSQIVSDKFTAQTFPGHSSEKLHATYNTLTTSRACNDGPNGSDNDQRCPNGQSGNTGISRAKLKTIKLTLTVVICYVLCWTPFFVGQMWAAYDPNAPYEGPFFTIIMLLASVNSCTNPWIYTIFSNTICQRTREIFRAPCGCLVACWKMARSCWSRKTPTSSGYLQPVHDSAKKRRIFEHTSFSTF